MNEELAEFLNKREIFDQEIKNRLRKNMYLSKIMQDYADEVVKNNLTTLTKTIKSIEE